MILVSDLEQAAFEAQASMFEVLDNPSTEVTLAEVCYAYRAAYNAWQAAKGKT